jgi:hypothetical protein
MWRKALGADGEPINVLDCRMKSFDCSVKLTRRADTCRPRRGATIESMRGLLASYGGADEATSSLTNVSVWADLAAAKQMDTFQPMLDLGKEFAAKGAAFERPIMNYATLWQLRPSATK